MPLAAAGAEAELQRLVPVARKTEIRSIISQVRQVLLADWDPLCVGGMPNLADEYDFVLNHVVAGLGGAGSEAEISDMLLELERDYICLPVPRRVQCDIAAKKLLDLRRQQHDWPKSTLSP